MVGCIVVLLRYSVRFPTAIPNSSSHGRWRLLFLRWRLNDLRLLFYPLLLHARILVVVGTRHDTIICTRFLLSVRDQSISSQAAYFPSLFCYSTTTIILRLTTFTGQDKQNPDLGNGTTPHAKKRMEDNLAGGLFYWIAWRATPTMAQRCMGLRGSSIRKGFKSNDEGQDKVESRSALEGIHCCLTATYY